MKGMRLFGDYALEFLVVSILVALSAFLVIPFIPMLVGLAGFFKRDINSRRFKDIFVTIGRSWKILIFYTIFELIIIIFPILNIYFFNTHPGSTDYFVLSICCIALVVGIIYLVTSPTIIVNMKVSFPQLLYNGIMLLFGGFIQTIISLCLFAGVIAIILFYPYLIVLTLYAVPLLNSKFMTENLYRLKAKAQNVSVFDLKKSESEDSYLSESGEISREGDNEEI